MYTKNGIKSNLPGQCKETMGKRRDKWTDSWIVNKHLKEWMKGFYFSDLQYVQMLKLVTFGHI